jgi:membrane complex biogenesis BtpA family protein
MRQPFFANRNSAKAIIGMVHLLPLPGAPRWGGSMQQVIDAAIIDAQALADGGVTGIMVENYGDTPFLPGRVHATTLAALTAAIVEIRRTVSIPIGVNVLRNDVASALAVCAATGASFVRVNVHTGAMLTDQGWISGEAHETLRLREGLALDAAIFADVFVKHATPPAGLTIEDAARDTWERGHADGLIVTGSGTGHATSPEDVRRVKTAVPEAPVLIGSGLTLENAAAVLEYADGAIVGTSLKENGVVSTDRVRKMVEVVARQK